MTDDVDVDGLAKLARLQVSDAELKELKRDIPAILKFVETINVSSAGVAQKEKTNIRNVMREDGEPHESGIYTEQLLASVPRREGNRVAVTQVLKKSGH